MQLLNFLMLHSLWEGEKEQKENVNIQRDKERKNC